MTNDYYSVLKKLFPVTDMTGQLDHDLAIEGKYLGRSDTSAQQLRADMFPDTVSAAMVGNWERVWDTTGSGLAGQRAALVAAERIVVNKQGRLNPSYFVSIALGHGYDSTVVEHGTLMFKVGNSIPPATALPGQLYESTFLYEWDLDSTGSTNAVDQTSLISAIQERAPAWTMINFYFA